MKRAEAFGLAALKRSPKMRFLLNFAVFLLVAPVALATSYAFTISNCFAQSAIVAEVELTDARI